VQSHDWTGVYPDIHAFCSADLSAFYFDIRKDALYCDRTDSHRRRACRSVLDLVQRCLCTWLAPVLCFTAEEAWIARFGEATSVHLEVFPDIPRLTDAVTLGLSMPILRQRRSDITTAVERLRQQGSIGSSLQAEVTLPRSWQPHDADWWAEFAIVSAVRFSDDTSDLQVHATQATGEKCERCWRVLPEVGSVTAHPTLCLRCADAVDSGLVGRAAA
jgi:isoleucyl-tRNA synthetase